MMAAEHKDGVGNVEAVVMEKGLLLDPEPPHRHSRCGCGYWAEKVLECFVIAAKTGLSFQIGRLWVVSALLCFLGYLWTPPIAEHLALPVLMFSSYCLLHLAYDGNGLRPLTVPCLCGSGVVVLNRWHPAAMPKSLGRESKLEKIVRRCWIFVEAALYIFLAFGFTYLNSSLWIQLKEQMILNRQLVEVPGIPSFVSKYAPVVWLDNTEIYLPSDMFAQIENTQPQVDYTPLPKVPSPLTVHNLDILNKYGRGGTDVFLTAEADITEEPDWLYGVRPDLRGKTRHVTSAVIIINDRGNGTLDAFYMYFYAYNQGNSPFGSELGNHVGDWEHNMIRFSSGVPEVVWYSQHGNGQAFAYDVVEKIGGRPVSYAAQGSHANYAIKGIHDHLIPDLNLPNGFLRDRTSQGSLWDPLLSAYWYIYDGRNETFSSAGLGSPLGAMQYRGRWGDEEYPDGDERQKSFFGFKKYVGGPTGPYDKDLNRTSVCSGNVLPCVIRTRLGP